jgi:hypothetical protein
VAKSGPARARGAAMKHELLEWVKSKCEPKGVQVTNFTSSWQVSTRVQSFATMRSAFSPHIRCACHV